MYICPIIIHLSFFSVNKKLKFSTCLNFAQLYPQVVDKFIKNSFCKEIKFPLFVDNFSDMIKKTIRGYIHFKLG